MPNQSAVAHSTHCAAYQCGHIERSDDRAVKRAHSLYLAREAGVTLPGMPGGEGADVLAALALMRAGRPCSEVRNYRTAGVNASNVPTMPTTIDPLTLSAQVVEVVTLALQGYDIPEVAAMTFRRPETVRSLFARARKATGTHTTRAAGVELARLGVI